MTEGIRRGGRKRILTEEMIEEMCAIIRGGNYALTAARRVGISEGSFYTWKTRGNDPEETDPLYIRLARDIEEAEAAREVLLTADVKVAGQKDWRAAAWLLSKTNPSRFGDSTKIQVDHSGSLEVGRKLTPVEEIVKRLTDEQLRDLEKLLAPAIDAILAEGSEEGEGEEGLPRVHEVDDT